MAVRFQTATGKLWASALAGVEPDSDAVRRFRIIARTAQGRHAQRASVITQPSAHDLRLAEMQESGILEDIEPRALGGRGAGQRACATIALQHDKRHPSQMG